MKIPLMTASIILLATLMLALPPAYADDEVVAHLDGKPITRAALAVEATVGNRAENEGMMLFQIVMSALTKRFAEERTDIIPTDQEVEAYQTHLDGFILAERKRWKQQEAELRITLKNESLDAKSRARAEEDLKLYESLNKQEDEIASARTGNEAAAKAASISVSRQMLAYWKTNRALYKTYGGRVIFQQAGLEPLDAYRKLLEEHEKKGTFRIVDKSLVPGFWKYVKTDTMHTFLNDEAEAMKMMLSDWWLGDGKGK